MIHKVLAVYNFMSERVDARSARYVRKRGDRLALLYLQKMSVMVQDVFAGQRNSSL